MSTLPSNNITSTTPRDSDYEWRYEYYEDDEPVSFEGLKAHRYSIVIGFWVGLAVFVLFMFFVLTLLTKTGAPHPESSEPCEKRVRLTSCGEDLGRLPDQLESQPCASRPLLEESRLHFHCYVNEEEHAANRHRSGAASHLGGVTGECSHSAVNSQSVSIVQETQAGDVSLPERDASAFMAHFNISNFVNSELSSTLGDDDLLLGTPPLILEGEARGLNGTNCDHMLE